MRNENIQHTEAPSKTRRTFFERFPLYVWVCFAYLLAIHFSVFYATRPLLPFLPAYDLSTPLDVMIPLSTPWITVYCLSFLSWLISFLWILSESKPHAYRITGVYSIVMLASLICFLAFPVTIQRPEITGTGLFDDWTRFIYRADAPTNLLPSLHVAASYVCWRGTMGCKKIPAWYRWFNLVFLILVCFSVLFVKQHFLADIGAALVITEGAFQIARAARIERIPAAIENRFRRK